MKQLRFEEIDGTGRYKVNDLLIVTVTEAVVLVGIEQKPSESTSIRNRAGVSD